MSHSERNSQVQCGLPISAFSYSTPSDSEWCQLTVPEQLPFLKPFRQDRLVRLPCVMATSKTIGNAESLTDLKETAERKNGGVDPYLKIQQLEKNLAFVQENHAYMLKNLHEEISDLKQKNRELLFEIVTGMPALPRESYEDTEDTDEEKEKLEKLEKEVRKLRMALKEALKANSTMSIQLQTFKGEIPPKSNQNKNFLRNPVVAAAEESSRDPPSGPSPQMEQYSETLQQIQRAATHRSGKRDDRRFRFDGKNDWPDNYGRNGFHHHHHRHFQKSHHDQQNKLPRLPLRNQQNYQQYEIQYHQRNNTASILPALVPVLDHKPRKPRGPTKMPDQVING